nr:unnamed protein product [Callosobruchus analis]
MDNKWQWALRVTPALGLIAVVLILIALDEPERGQSEGSGHMEPTPWTEDVKDIVQNRSFMFSTAGFTCVAFVAGALAWWGPTFIEMGIKLQDQGGTVDSDSTSFIFGAITMLAGIAGLSLGAMLSQWLKPTYRRCDPIICGCGLIFSAPFLLATTYACTRDTLLCYVLLFIGQVLLNLNWAIVSDILLYVVLPTRRSTAEGFQLLLSEAFIIGMKNKGDSPDLQDFKSLQYALFSTCFVEVIGGLFFLITAFYIVQDKKKVEEAVHGKHA